MKIKDWQKKNDLEDEMRKWRDGKLLKTGARSAAQRTPERDKRLMIPAPSWSNNDTPYSAFFRPGEIEELAVTAMMLFNEQSIAKNEAGFLEATKRLKGLCAGVAERTKQTIASNRRSNVLYRDARRADRDWKRERAERRAKRRAAKQ